MNAVSRVTIASALALACLDGHAKVLDKCIRTLEARAERPDAPAPCPKAIGYLVPRQAATAPTTGSASPCSRRDFARSVGSVLEANRADADSTDQPDPALHV
jgi:hypothetical protein